LSDINVYKWSKAFKKGQKKIIFNEDIITNVREKVSLQPKDFFLKEYKSCRNDGTGVLKTRETMLKNNIIYIAMFF